MSNPIPFLLQGKNIIMVIDGKSHTVSRDTHIAYSKIVDALKAQEWDTLRELVEPSRAIVNFGQGYVSVEGDKVLWKGVEFHNALSTRMIEMFHDGFPIDPMVRFMENLMSNPSKRSVDQVYGFLEKNSLPITEDGFFLAFKKVRQDYMDIHSGTISNHVGAVVTMERNLVDDNPDSYCSTGLHFCSISYLSSFGNSSDPVMILKINPADVVSIPNDYNGAKGRCSKYEVVAQVTGDPVDAFASVVNKQFSEQTVHVDDDQGTDGPLDWPFPTVAPVENTPVVRKMPPVSVVYDVVRVSNNVCHATGVTLDVARDMVDKNRRQKKANLQIVVSGTTTVVQ